MEDRNDRRYRFIHSLRGVPEAVIAAVEATDEVPSFRDTPIFSELVCERGNPLRDS